MRQAWQGRAPSCRCKTFWSTGSLGEQTALLQFRALPTLDPRETLEQTQREAPSLSHMVRGAAAGSERSHHFRRRLRRSREKRNSGSGAPPTSSLCSGPCAPLPGIEHSRPSSKKGQCRRCPSSHGHGCGIFSRGRVNACQLHEGEQEAFLQYSHSHAHLQDGSFAHSAYMRLGRN